MASPSIPASVGKKFISQLSFFFSHHNTVFPLVSQITRWCAGGGLLLFLAFLFTHRKKPKSLPSYKSNISTCVMTIQQYCQTLAYPRTAELQLSTQPVKSIDTHTTITTITTLPNPETIPQVIHDPSLLDHPDRDDSSETLLVVSPYRSRPHLLSLPSLQPSQQLLAKALTTLQPIRSDYATCPYDLAFNWPTVTDALRALAQKESFFWPTQHFYIVVFRSQIPPTTNRADLAALDRASHVEATKSGGLLKYWFGVPDASGRNLATCVWRKQADAKPGSAGAGHRAAMRATMSLYTEWRVERLKLVIEGDGQGGVGGWWIGAWEEIDG